MIAKCGLDCEECNAYKATVQNSDELRKKTSEEWSVMFGASIDPASIHCLGCQQDEKLFSHCNVCGIRSCAKEERLSTCADCPDYGCEKNSEIWRHAPEAKQNLEKLRA